RRARGEGRRRETTFDAAADAAELRIGVRQPQRRLRRPPRRTGGAQRGAPRWSADQREARQLHREPRRRHRRGRHRADRAGAPHGPFGDGSRATSGSAARRHFPARPPARVGAAPFRAHPAQEVRMTEPAWMRLPFRPVRGAAARRLAPPQPRGRGAAAALLRTAVAVLLSAGVSVVAWQAYRWSTTTPLFALREVRFAGLVHAAEQDLLARSALRPGANLTALDL